MEPTIKKKKSLPTRLSGMIGRVFHRSSTSSSKRKETMSKAVLADTTLESMDPDVKTLQDLCDSFHFQCHECQAALSLDCGDGHLGTWRAQSQEIPPKIQFSELSCGVHSTCAGCGSKPNLSSQHIFTPLGVLNHCCDPGRLFGIWVLLARFDEKELKATAVTPTATKKKLPKGRYASMPNGVGYAAENVYGEVEEYMLEAEDFAMDALLPEFHPAFHVTVQPASKHKEHEKSMDTMMTETLRLLAKFLPPQDADATAELNLFRMSLLFERIVDLLRNDSIEDISKRSEMFLEICQFLKAIASHPGLVSLLVDNLPRKKTPGLRVLGLRLGNGAYNIQSSSPSMYAASANSYRQAKMFLKLIENTDSKEDRKSSMETCMTIIELYEMLERIVTARKPPSIVEIATNGAADEEAWKLFAEENRVTFTDDVLIKHRCEKDFKGTQSSAQNGRLNTISKEVATLTTSLPTGIFVKVAESRMDVMKVLIVGSEGSPYAGGLFIFDMFLPANYPLGPPKMFFVLDGNDSEQYSFNPNLHKGGTVCLSILNTWHGSASEMWQPNKSTILSVLISIQAMILGAPLPWLNEPGMEIQGQSTIAIEHKHLMQMKTIKYAMIAWFENSWKPSTKTHIWKETVQTYWKYNSNKVLEYAKEWSCENPRLLRWVNTPDLIGMHKKVTKTKGKGKGKATEAEDLASEKAGENLVEMLAQRLGVDYTAPRSMKREITDDSENRKRGAEIASGSSVNASGLPYGPSSAKKQKSETPGVNDSEGGTRWIYTGQRSFKEVRAACKEFGVGAKKSIADSVKALESHVNAGNLKVQDSLTTKYGDYVDEGPGAASGTGFGSWPSSPEW